MTPKELEYEWQVIYDTRLGMLCGSDKPTEFMILIAKDEATEHVNKLRLLDGVEK